MNLTTEDIQQEIDEHLLSLERFTHYRYLPGDEKKTIAEIILDADVDSEEFNLGYEQGYLAGLNFLLTLSKENIR